MKLLILGAPGAGKGTQAVRICERYAIPHISTGDMFRENISKGTPLGKLAKSYIDAGKLVPDEVTLGMVKDRLSRPDCENGFLLDGFPRTLAQADGLKELTALDCVLNVDVDEASLLSRITRRRVCPKCAGTYHVSTLAGDTCPACGEKLAQRADDTEETVKARLDVYNAQTKPLIAYYGEQVKTVDGNLPPEKVFEAIQAVLEAL
ncbi:MAG: adenylate kinase [Clostridia bacterium]|nr:adenylate kinase [Clostridia bacterium]